MKYCGSGKGVNIILFQGFKEDDEARDTIVFDDGIVSPTANAQVIFYGPEGFEDENPKVVNGLYGCLPNRDVVVAIPEGSISDFIDPNEILNVRVILDPYTDFDPHTVEDLTLQNFEVDDGDSESEVPDNRLGRFE